MECPVCLSLYNLDARIPVVLPCGHSLCKECASSLKSVDSAISCPQCRKSSPLSSELPLNYSILDQLSIRSKPEGGEEEDKCELHQTKRVKFFCSKCGKFFCSKCVVLHTSEGHQIEAANVQIDRTLQQLTSKLSLRKTQLRDSKAGMADRLTLLHKQREAINQGYEQLLAQIQRERDDTLTLVTNLLGKQEEMIHRTDEEEKFATEIGEELTKAQHSKTSIKAKQALIEKANSGLLEEGKKQKLVEVSLEIKMMQVPSQGIIQVTPLRNSKNPPNPRLRSDIEVLGGNAQDVMKVGRWEYLNNREIWVPYAANANAELEKALKSGKKLVIVGKYKVDLVNFVQVNTTTEWSRAVRRVA